MKRKFKILDGEIIHKAIYDYSFLFGHIGEDMGLHAYYDLTTNLKQTVLSNKYIHQ